MSVFDTLKICPASLKKQSVLAYLKTYIIIKVSYIGMVIEF
jgi:hypothetical protein